KFLVAGSAICAAGLFHVSRAGEGEAWMAAAGCAAAGFGLILYLSTGQSTLQLTVPNEKRGRVMALWAITLSASAPLGHLIAGQAVTVFGVRPVLVAMGTGVGVCAALAGVLAMRGQRRLASRARSG